MCSKGKIVRELPLKHSAMILVKINAFKWGNVNTAL